ncbi:MAG: hypothetical protein LUH59_04305 [Firmicutes bacterium]|nr:hypothetical protein [Bacillota bacterium]
MKKFFLIFLCAVMMFCTFGCADSADNSTDGTENGAAETDGNADVTTSDTETNEVISASFDATEKYLGYVFDEDIVLEIVTENITTNTEKLRFSIQNNSDRQVGYGESDILLYTYEDGKYYRIYNGGIISTTDVAMEIEVGGFMEQNANVLNWFGELESGEEYILVVEFDEGVCAYGTFTVK